MSEEEMGTVTPNPNSTWCRGCKRTVKPKLNFSWLIVIATLLLFWPATVAYLGYKLYMHDYLCPICEMPL